MSSALVKRMERKKEKLSRTQQKTVTPKIQAAVAGLLHIFGPGHTMCSDSICWPSSLAILHSYCYGMAACSTLVWALVVQHLNLVPWRVIQACTQCAHNSTKTAELKRSVIGRERERERDSESERDLLHFKPDIRCYSKAFYCLVLWIDILRVKIDAFFGRSSSLFKRVSSFSCCCCFFFFPPLLLRSSSESFSSSLHSLRSFIHKFVFSLLRSLRPGISTRLCLALTVSSTKPTNQRCHKHTDTQPQTHEGKK